MIIKHHKKTDLGFLFDLIYSGKQDYYEKQTLAIFNEYFRDKYPASYYRRFSVITVYDEYKIIYNFMNLIYYLKPMPLMENLIYREINKPSYNIFPKTDSWGGSFVSVSLLGAEND